MDDAEIVQRIGELVDQEHALEHSHEGDGLSDEDVARMKSLEVALDQCWDLLRQRDALRNAGGNPDAANARPVAEVEGYLQ